MLSKTTIQEVQTITFQKQVKGQMSANLGINIQFIT